MKRLFVAGVGLLALAGAAAAADLPPAPGTYYKAPVYAPPFSWTGFYVGVNGGGGLAGRIGTRPAGSAPSAASSAARSATITSSTISSSVAKATSIGAASGARPIPRVAPPAAPRAILGYRRCAHGSATGRIGSCPMSPAVPPSAISTPRRPVSLGAARPMRGGPSGRVLNSPSPPTGRQKRNISSSASANSIAASAAARLRTVFPSART